MFINNYLLNLLIILEKQYQSRTKSEILNYSGLNRNNSYSSLNIIENNRIKDMNLNNSNIKTIKDFPLSGNSEFIEITRSRDLILKGENKGKMKQYSLDRSLKDYKSYENLYKNMKINKKMMINNSLTNTKSQTNISYDTNLFNRNKKINKNNSRDSRSRESKSRDSKHNREINISRGDNNDSAINRDKSENKESINKLSFKSLFFPQSESWMDV